MLKTKKINSIKVKPVIVTKKEEDFCKELLPRANANVWFCAKTNSGKTVALFTMLKCLYKNARKRKKMFILVPFAGKANKDPTWQRILDYFEEKEHASVWDPMESDDDSGGQGGGTP